MAGFIGAGTAIGAAGMADTANVFAQDAQNTEYTVTFKNNGQGNVPDALKVASGKTIARAVNYDAKKLRPAVTVIDGYKFDDSGTSWGLYTDEACTKAFDVFNTPITKNTTLYVKWVPVQTHKITFKANGVTADPPAIVDYYAVIAPGLTPRQTRSFLSWIHLFAFQIHYDSCFFSEQYLRIFVCPVSIQIVL